MFESRAHALAQKTSSPGLETPIFSKLRVELYSHLLNQVRKQKEEREGRIFQMQVELDLFGSTLLKERLIALAASRGFSMTLYHKEILEGFLEALEHYGLVPKELEKCTEHLLILFADEARIEYATVRQLQRHIYRVYLGSSASNTGISRIRDAIEVFLLRLLIFGIPARFLFVFYDPPPA
jgi:predicted DNA-binding protein